MAPSNTEDRTQTVFASPITNLRLVRANRLEEESRFGGSRTTVSPGLVYEFENGFLTITDEIRDRDAKFFEKYVEVDDSLSDTRPAEEWLRDHHLFQVEKGFVEVARAVEPSSPALLAVTNALVDGDVVRLVEIFEAEEAGDRRPDVMEAVTRALKSLEAAEEPVPG